jgi:hypothetical protein
VFGPAVFIRETRNCFAKMPFSLAPAAARARSPISASGLGRTRLRDLWNAIVFDLFAPKFACKIKGGSL